MSLNMKSNLIDSIKGVSTPKKINQQTAQPQKSEESAQESIIQQRSLHYVAAENGEIEIQVIDKETNEVIRTIPEKLLNELLQESMKNQGLFINAKI